MRSCLFCALILLGSASPAWAQSVALQGMLGSKALLIIDGGAPRTLGPGQSAQGVKVLSTMIAAPWSVERLRWNWTLYSSATVSTRCIAPPTPLASF